MVSQRAVSALFALTCIAAPLLRVSCADYDGFDSILDGSNKANVDIHGQSTNTPLVPQKEGGDDDEYGAVPMPGGIDSDDSNVGEGSTEAPVAMPAQPAVVSSNPPTAVDSSPSKPQDVVVAEGGRDPQSDEGNSDEDNKSEASPGFLSRLKQSVGKGLSSLKSKIPKLQTSSDSSVEESTSGSAKED